MGKREHLENIIWDFDGVIVESNHIREKGFRKVLKNFPENQVEELLVFHNDNGGLSRYVKFRHFFENTRKEEISEVEVNNYAKEFSIIMKELMTDKGILISETNEFLKNNYRKYNFHIASGSDEKELNFLCQKLGIAEYFLSIKGSPKPKNDIVKDLLADNNYSKEETILIGDARNDFIAAKTNGIYFMGYNTSKELIDKSDIVLDFSK